MVASFTTPDLSLSVDPTTGQWLSLTGGHSGRSWLSPIADDCPGLPFLSAGAVDPGVLVPLEITALEQATSRGTATVLMGRSRRGGCRVRITAEGNAIVAEYTLPARRGPRAGLHLPLDHLDREFDQGTVVDRSEQLMPVIVETDPHYQWSYLAWHRSESDLLVTVVDGQHSGWRMMYSYTGHRMVGFRILAQADDVISPDETTGGRLPTTAVLRLKLALASSRSHAIEVAHELLRRPVPPRRRFSFPGWSQFASRSINFYLEHFQLGCGAMARAVAGDTLQPDRRATSGRHFGNPHESDSCMTGEFGGFGAWSALLHRAVIDTSVADLSVARYFDWLLNRSASTPAEVLPGTIWPPRIDPPGAVDVMVGPAGTQTSAGASMPAANHLWGVANYAQHEAWAIAQLADAVALGMEEFLEPLSGVLEHFVSDHIGADGEVTNRHHEGPPKDYCTVDAPLVHLVRAARVVEQSHPDLARRVFEVARGVADYILKRDFDFPTEGEQCTEDGSIACAAWSLAFAANELCDPNPAWLELAREFLQFHKKLEMTGLDSRTDGSTIRFWETMYESDDWGPSINAGHGWTLWTAFAEFEMHRATGEYHWLRAAWDRTLCVASKARSDGGFPVCYTPDPVPQIPHADVPEAEYPGKRLGTAAYRREGEMTTVRSGNRYTDSLSMSSMLLFIFAARTWHSSFGYDPDSGVAVNARVTGSAIEPDTLFGCSRVALARLPERPFSVKGLRPDNVVRITVDPRTITEEADLDDVQVRDADVINRGEWYLDVRPTADSIRIGPRGA